MFDNKDSESIIDEMLDNADTSVDTRQGSIIYDTVSPIAMELEQAYVDISMVEDECFADTASYYYLVKRAAERGIFPIAGTAAVLKILVDPVTCSIATGTEFNIGELNYTITENLGNGYYSLTCEETGVSGNNTTDDVIPMEDIEDLDGVEVTEIITPGKDDEDEDHLRDRYFDSFVEVAFGGNKAEYKERADSMSVVGGCKVVPVWNGGGTVKLIILGADYSVASSSAVSTVQEAFDPTQDGTGVGIAPIGHKVTVVSAVNTTVNVSFTVTMLSGHSWSDVSESCSEAIDNYMLDLRKTWEDETATIVRVGQIEAIVLSLPGVTNVTNVKLNNVAGNLTLATNCVPVKGSVTNG